MFRLPPYQIMLLCGVCALFAIGCNTSGFGIFYSIQNEEPLSDNESLPNTISAAGMARLGDTYYLSAGRLYTRDIDGEIWETLSPPEDGYLVGPLFVWGGAIYAVAYSIDGESSSLYKLSGDTWQSVPVSGADTELVAAAVASGGSIVATVRDDLLYRSYQSLDGTSFVELALAEQMGPITDAVDFEGNTWLLSGGAIYRSTAPSTYERYSPESGPATSAGYSGIFASPAGMLFVSTLDGNLYVLKDGSWIEKAIVDANNNALALFDMDEVVIGSDTVVLIGTEKGYRELILSSGQVPDNLVVPGTADSLTTDENYQRITLKDVAIRSFLVDQMTIFACTAGNGLWANPIDIENDVKKWDPE